MPRSPHHLLTATNTPAQTDLGAWPPWASHVLTFLPLVVVFTLALAHPLDPDLGWHLKYGEYFSLHHSMPPGNTFSAEMAGYPYVNHAWGSDFLLYTVFRTFGFTGITLLGATVITATFACFSRAARLTFWEEALLFPPMLYLLYPIVEQSFRSQLVSLLGMGVMFLILERAEKKHLTSLPAILPLFLLWANGHGQFIVGLGLYACWGGAYLLRAWIAARADQAPFPRRDLVIIAVTGLGAGMVSLLTPHGMAIYTEIARHAGNQFQQHINEWQPISLEARLWWPFLAWGVLLALSVTLITRRQQLLAKAHYLLPTLLMFLATFQQRRHFWPMVLISMPIAAPLIARLRPKRNAVATTIACTILVGAYLYGGMVNLPRQHIFAFDWDLYCRHLGCTSESANILESGLSGQRLLTDYDWGGWLIWNYPAIKPTIDGRMPFWQDEQGYSAYGKYLGLESGETDIDLSPYTVVYWSPKKEALFNRLTQLVAEKKWREVYADPFASIFVRNQAR
jgi:hypothetical protein